MTKPCGRVSPPCSSPLVTEVSPSDILQHSPKISLDFLRFSAHNETQWEEGTHPVTYQTPNERPSLTVNL